jgi:hypothetical protein
LCEVSSGIDHAQGDGDWHRIDLIVDSGAAASVIPRILAEKLGVEISTAEKTFASAIGQQVVSHGYCMLPVTLVGWKTVRVKFWILEVQRPLLSVGRLVSSGGRFEANANGGCIHLAGGRFEVFLRYGVYVLPGWVDMKAVHPFPRQA